MRINCINTTSGICQSLSSVQVWMFPPNLHTRHGVTYRLPDVLIQLILLTMSTRVIETCTELTVTYIEWHIPDVVLIQLILLMMSTVVLEAC